MRHDFTNLSLPWRRNYQQSLHLMAQQSITTIIVINIIIIIIISTIIIIIMSAPAQC